MVKENSNLQPRRARTGDQLRAVTWTPAPDMPYPDWVTAGRRIGATARASNWWVGDWIRYGTRRWGEKYAAASRMTGYDVHTLRNMAYVASHFDSSLRRDDLSWSHHSLLAGLEPGERASWLERAARERMSVADLRAELRAAQRDVSKPAKDGSNGTSAADATTCPHCGGRIESDKPDWDAFVGDVVRRRYGTATIERRHAA